MPIILPSDLFEDDSDSDLLLGLEFYDSHKWAEALLPLEKAATKGNVTAVFKLANSLSNLDREDEALPLWEAAAVWGHVGACNNFAIRLNAVGDTEGARDLYRRSAAAGNAQAMFNLALTYDENTEADLYREWLKKAGEAGMLRAQAMLGNHLYNNGEPEEGLNLLEDAIGKQSLSGHILAASIAFQKGDFERSYNLAEKALSLPLIDDDKHMLKNAFMIRGVSGDKLGYREQAIADIKKAKETGFDVSSAPLHLRAPKSARRLTAPSSSQATLHFESLQR